MTSAEVREKDRAKERKIGQRKRSEGKGYGRAGRIKGKDETRHYNGRAESTKENDRQSQTEQSLGQKTRHGKEEGRTGSRT